MNFTALSQGRHPSAKLKGERLRGGMSFPKAAGLEVTEYQENSGLMPRLIKVQPRARPSTPPTHSWSDLSGRSLCCSRSHQLYTMSPGVKPDTEASGHEASPEGHEGKSTHNLCPQVVYQLQSRFYRVGGTREESRLATTRLKLTNVLRHKKMKRKNNSTVCV